QDTGTVAYTVAGDLGITMIGTILCKCDTCRICSVKFRSISHQGTPSAADVQVFITGFHHQLLTYHGHLTVLRLFQRFGFRIMPVSAGIYHTGAEEKTEKII